jgi:hypothetical protein
MAAKVSGKHKVTVQMERTTLLPVFARTGRFAGYLFSPGTVGPSFEKLCDSQKYSHGGAQGRNLSFFSTPRPRV